MNKKEAKQLVEQFEAGSYPASDWTHESHIVMGLWYLYHFSTAEATTKIREGVKHYNLSQGGVNSDTEGYHETITIFYIKILDRFLHGTDADFDQILKAMMDEPFMRSAFPFDYYTKELLMSVKARKEWVAPDLLPISSYRSTRPVSA